jgi:hypothetical protein
MADSISLISVADTTLIELNPDNNNGGMTFFNCGTTQNYTRNRGLLKFNVAGSIPGHSQITSAYLTLSVIHSSSGGLAIPYFDLHRVLKDWGEGTNTYSTSTGLGQGTPATVGEATWNDRFALTTNHWNAPGGAAAMDYSPVITASQIIYTEVESPYFFSNSPPDAPQLVGDVQSWLDHPETNFGWILICDDESVAFTAHRISSREGDPFMAPTLVIEYTPPPRIDGVDQTGNEFNLHFTAQAGRSYTVEFTDALSLTNAWQTLTNIPPPSADTNLVVSDVITNRQRFYRLGRQ